MTNFLEAKDVDYALSGLRMRAEQIVRMYRKGRLTNSELTERFYSAFGEAYMDMLTSHGLYRRITERSWPRFQAEYALWRRGEVPEAPGEQWLMYYSFMERFLPGQDARLERFEASPEDKAQFFRLTDALGIPEDYFVPEPDATPRPNMRILDHGLLQDMRSIEFCGADASALMSEPDPVGKTFTLVNDHGLTARFTVTEVVPEEDRFRRRGTFAGMGTIEGYTTDREREIMISVETLVREHIFLNLYMDRDDDALFDSFPLWQPHLRFEREAGEKQAAVVAALIDRFMREMA